MPHTKLKDFLDRNGVKYVRISHSPRFTAQEIAQTTHIPGEELAKTVMVKLDGRMAMAVLPATQQVDLEALRHASGAKNVDLADEKEFKDLFPDCEVGAMPPFGNLYELPVFVAELLGEQEEIAFNAGTHTELYRLPYADFERLVKPRRLEFATATV